MIAAVLNAMAVVRNAESIQGRFSVPDYLETVFTDIAMLIQILTDKHGNKFFFSV